ncbi:MAG: threonylcarbamoyl-AMP synthase [Candidatus Omnitrophica bacterium]|nr:threonylcarbamoyl-AMP synthase [Candidatus Omnitrophota bacterium]
METKLIKFNPDKIDSLLLQEAARVINGGGLVAFPTETVYGLGADALNPLSCAKIFEAKNRPLNDPLIVHIADKQDIFKVAGEIYKRTLGIIDEFWPGPLTLVLKKSQNIPQIVTAGLETVAVRMPDNPIALALIKEAQTPIAAPSANLFGRPSPTTAQHVFDDLKGRIDMIVDGGKTQVGVESTILDLTQTPSRILRPGGIDIEALRRLSPDIESYQGNRILSPGMFTRHYSPKARVIVVEDGNKTQPERVKDIASEFISQGYSVGIMAKDENKNHYNGDFNLKILGPEKNLALCAANLYSLLREFDKDGTQIIIAESVKEDGLGITIMDRLRKAAAKESDV